MSARVLGLTTVVACGGTLDAGSNRKETLPVGPENPVIVTNDGPSDNWQGEFALLLARAAGRPLAGLLVSAGGSWYDLDANVAGWQDLVDRARQSGIGDIPDPIRSASAPLVKPGDGAIDSTTPNDSEGARFIVETSLSLGRPERPLVVATGGRLTDVADAYLLDPGVVERVVVVASLGTGFEGGEKVARMGVPNGEMDPWADVIVAQRFRYVQVSAYYDQRADVPPERLGELPANAFGDRMREKQPDILGTPLAADQVSVIALGIPEFVREVTRVSPSSIEAETPTLVPARNGNAWLVTASDGAAATRRFWELLSDAATFGG
ncbi:MAG TPA: hypothetical protein VFZ53_35050 [Polyangiaceae bacterium]